MKYGEVLMGSEVLSENIKFPQRGNFIRQFYSLAPLRRGTLPAHKTERFRKYFLAHYASLFVISFNS